MAAVADAPQGILLYYKYVDLDKEQQGVAEFYEKLCLEHSLRGRVRVAKDGVNVTVSRQGRALHSAPGRSVQWHLLRQIPVVWGRISMELSIALGANGKWDTQRGGVVRHDIPPPLTRPQPSCRTTQRHQRI